MTNKNDSEKRQQKWSSSKLLDCIAYFAIMCIAVALIFQLIFKNNGKVASAFQAIGSALAYIICIWLGFYWTRRNKNIWWFICWLVASVLIVVIYIFAVVVI